MEDPVNAAPAADRAPARPVRAYVAAALLVPPRGVRMGWRMQGCSLPTRVVLAALPLIGPVGGVVFLLQKFGVMA